MNIYERETANSIKLELKTLLQNEPATSNQNTDRSEQILKHRLQQVKPAFEKIIENCGSTYAPVLAQCKQRYDRYIDFLHSKQAAIRIKHDLQAQQMHESSANEIYQKRQEEILRKIDILKKKRELTLKDLEGWQQKNYKLKLEPDVIEIDVDSEERKRREYLKTLPKNFHKIPGLKIDELSLDYSEKLKTKWKGRLDKVVKTKASEFVKRVDFENTEKNRTDLENKIISAKNSIEAEKNKSNKLRKLLACLKKTSETAINKKLSQCSINSTDTIEIAESDSVLIKFWEYLNENTISGSLKAVTLALVNRKFHVAGTLAIFLDHDLNILKLDSYARHPNSTAYQFVSGLDKIIDYSNQDKTISSELTDGIVEILREKCHDKHFAKASLNCARMLCLTGNTACWLMFYEKKKIFFKF